MFGLFVEHGPYVVYKNMTGKKRFGSTAHALRVLESWSERYLTSLIVFFAVGLRDYAWTSSYSILYVDNPVSIYALPKLPLCP